MLWMLVGCLSIFLLLFLLPVFGFNGNNSLFIFLLIFFVAHLFMMGRHGGHGGHGSHSEHNHERINPNNQLQSENIPEDYYVGHEGTVLFFNSLLHGLDTSTIIRVDVPLSEALIGLVETFILGWLFGALIASVYNFSFNKKYN